MNGQECLVQLRGKTSFTYFSPSSQLHSSAYECVVLVFARVSLKYFLRTRLLHTSSAWVVQPYCDLRSTFVFIASILAVAFYSHHFLASHCQLYQIPNSIHVCRCALVVLYLVLFRAPHIPYFAACTGPALPSRVQYYYRCACVSVPPGPNAPTTFTFESPLGLLNCYHLYNYQQYIHSIRYVGKQVGRQVGRQCIRDWVRKAKRIYIQ